jgi:hypothetical membrane protein
MASLDPLRTSAPDATLGIVRWPWLIFGSLLVCGMVGFSVSADWSSQSWLDLAAIGVSVVSISGVFLYGLGRAPSGAAFWGAFRWVFIGVVALQALSHAIEVAGRHKYSAAGTVIFVLFAAVLIGWIYLLQWIAMSRLSNEQRS